jgi:hypothetical protein
MQPELASHLSKRSDHSTRMKLTDPSRKRIELISNIVIICAAVGFGAVLFRNHILKSPVLTVLKPEPGEVLQIDGENVFSAIFFIVFI